MRLGGAARAICTWGRMPSSRGRAAERRGPSGAQRLDVVALPRSRPNSFCGRSARGLRRLGMLDVRSSSGALGGGGASAG